MTLVDCPELRLLFGRRSVASLSEPAPAPDQLDVLLRAAATVPDHGSLRPWRLIVIQGEARERFADALADSATGLMPDLPPETRDRVRAKAFVAPMQIAIVASPIVGAKIEEWEQVATASCAGFAIVLAAHALGFGAMWKSVPFTRGTGLTNILGLADHEQLLGWVNVGTTSSTLNPRPPADSATFTTHLSA